ncbi:chloride channel protein 2 [Pelomyxa schiedti]|nr:chloride channel protein 2 [Pelomyxa schiedti]
MDRISGEMSCGEDSDGGIEMTSLVKIQGKEGAAPSATASTTQADTTAEQSKLDGGARSATAGEAAGTPRGATPRGSDLVTATRSFVASRATEVTVLAGEIIELLDDGDSPADASPDSGVSAKKWRYGRNSITGKIGYFPSFCLGPASLPQETLHKSRCLRLRKRCFETLEFKNNKSVIHIVLLFLISMAVITAGVSYAMDLFIKQMYKIRYQIVDSVPWLGVQYMLWFADMSFLSLAAFFIAKFITFLSQIKTILSGVPMPNYLSFRTLVSKVLGLSCAAGSGMYVGKQGPMVHIGAMISSNMLRLPAFHVLGRNDELKTQLLIAGAACGIAAHFGTPIGVVTAYSSTRSYWFASVASIFSATVTRLLYNHYEKNPNLWGPFFDFQIDLIARRGSQIALIILALLMGICCGLMAVVFIKITYFIGKMKRAFPRFPLFRWPILYLISVTVATSLVTFPYGIGQFMSLSPFALIRDLLTENIADCSSCEATDWNAYGNVIYALLILFSIMFVLETFHISCRIPIGLYVTNLVIGMIFGRMIGECLAYTDLGIPPAVFSLLCSSAYIAAVTRTFSSCMIVIELTGQGTYIIPIILATSISVIVSRLLSVSIFETIIQAQGLPFLPDVQYEDEETNVEKTMDPTPPFICVDPTLEEVENLLENHPPENTEVAVVNNRKDMLLVGQVGQEKLRQQYRQELQSAKELCANLPPLTSTTAPHTETTPAATTPSDPVDIGTPLWRIPLEMEKTHPVVHSTRLSHVHLTLVNFQLPSVFVTKEGRLCGWVARSHLKETITKQRQVIP